MTKRTLATTALILLLIALVPWSTAHMYIQTTLLCGYLLYSAWAACRIASLQSEGDILLQYTRDMINPDERECDIAVDSYIRFRKSRGWKPPIAVA